MKSVTKKSKAKSAKPVVLAPLYIPRQIYVDDYHEFSYLENFLKILNPKIKVGELGCNGQYVGLIYMNKKDFTSAKKEWDKQEAEAEEICRYCGNMKCHHPG